MNSKNDLIDDEQNIHQIIQRLGDAWNAGDANAFAGHFADDADFINVLGTHVKGRNEVAKVYLSILDTIYKNSTTSYTVESIRFLGADVAIAFIHAHLKVAHDGDLLEGYARPTMIFAKSDEKWEIVAYQNTPIAEKLVRTERTKSSFARES